MQATTPGSAPADRAELPLLPLVPETPEAEMAAAIVRLVRQLKSLRGGDPTMACLGTVRQLGPIRISALAEQLALDISTASRHVSHLEAEHLLARQPDPADLRATLLTLTPDGIEVLRQGMARRSELLRAATADWPESDPPTLTTLLNRLADDLGAIVHNGEST